MLILHATGAPGTVHGLSLASAGIVFAASLFAAALSFAEHSRAQRPSTLLGVYIFLTVLFDIVQTRTAWLAIANSHHTTLARLFTSSLAVKAIILGLEAYPKTRWIHWNAEEHSPEESTSFFSLGVYYWLNKLFLRGYRGVLAIDDLYPLDTTMTAQKMNEKLFNKMQIQNYHSQPRLGLFKDLCRSLVGPCLLPVAPRVALIGFKFCQPFFISTMLDYLQEPKESRKEEFGYGLVGACVIIYTGIAISMAFYNYYNEKVIYMMRGSLVAAIYKKTTETKLGAADDSAAVTLMSTDIERIIRGGRFVHEMWANVIEVAIGCWLLEGQLGTAFVAPIVVILASTAMLAGLTRFVGKRQNNWMSRIQNRVGLTANAISNMKLYKISGITGPVSDLIQSLRVAEIQIGNQYRWLIIFAALIAFSPMAFAPVITFAVTSRELDVTTIFTSLSYLLLVTTPLAGMFQNIPNMLAALTCFQRIQRFLVADPRVDFREFPNKPIKDATKGDPNASNSDGLAFAIEDGSFGWGDDKLTLSHIDARVPAKRLTLVVGPVASGKSTFCKVLLGEMPVYHGRVIAMSSRIGYCEQTPFLYNSTLKENIIGHCLFDQTKYDDIIDATMLGPDIGLLPQGHDTKIGSNGIMLSGGQKQRVSVARALYSESEVLIFDDILSGLDTDTEAELFRRVFGPHGIVKRRNVTAVVCTHSVRHMPSADHIIALGDGTVVEEGNFQDLMKNNKYVQSLGVTEKMQGVEKIREKDTQAVVSTKPLSKSVDAALDDRSRQMGDWSIYGYYFRSTSPFSITSLVVTCMIYGFCSSFSTVWMSFWAADAFSRANAFYIGIFGLLKVCQLTALLGNGVTTLISMITFSGNVLHQRAINTVIAAPLRFFATTDSGVVTNLFSQDMTLIDGELPMAFTNVTLDMADVIGMAFVVASASPYLAIAYIPLIVILYFMQMFYLRTSRQIRLLDLEAKSPL